MIVIERAVSADFSKEAHSKAAGMLGDAMFAGEAGNHSRADACQQTGMTAGRSSKGGI
jgi:hypothetical protein